MGLKIKEDITTKETKYSDEKEMIEQEIQTLKESLDTLGINHATEVQEVKQTPGYKRNSQLRRMTQELAEMTKLMETLRTAVTERE